MTSQYSQVFCDGHMLKHVPGVPVKAFKYLGCIAGMGLKQDNYECSNKKSTALLGMDKLEAKVWLGKGYRDIVANVGWPSQGIIERSTAVLICTHSQTYQLLIRQAQGPSVCRSHCI